MLSEEDVQAWKHWIRYLSLEDNLSLSLNGWSSEYNSWKKQESEPMVLEKTIWKDRRTNRAELKATALIPEVVTLDLKQYSALLALMERTTLFLFKDG